MMRRRRVRFRYPRELVELVRRRACVEDLRVVASEVGIPLSTAYRWTRADQAPDTLAAADTAALIARCRQLGCLADAAEGRTAPADRGTENLAAGMTAVNPPLRRAQDIPQRLRAAHKLIVEKYNHPFDCSELARLSGMSRDGFIHSYTAAFGVSPYRHLIRFRLAKAANLLSTTLQRGDLIAAAVGFGSYVAMAKAFRRVLGIGLSEYCQRSGIPVISRFA